MTNFKDGISEILLTEEQIQNRIKELAAQINEEYKGKDPVFVGVLRGVVVFFADFIRHFDDFCQIDFMCISSYRGTQSTGECIITKDVSIELRNRHVIILEDILDTGKSLDFCYNFLQTKKPASLKIVTLLDKPDRRKPWIDIKADYTGFVIPDKFVVGYGLDCNERYRNLPYVAVVKPEVYQ
ncbi:MAG: hypoxanthine phosphoribosyltransferase [Oscillospiraceae bacterium]|nr:hypoxanthine phosphoribosyltransferase [Oscillospiraceae bacterium]